MSDCKCPLCGTTPDALGDAIKRIQYSYGSSLSHKLIEMQQLEKARGQWQRQYERTWAKYKKTFLVARFKRLVKRCFRI